MGSEQLLALRDLILSDIGPLALDGEKNADSFALLLRVIQAGNASNELYSKAYESAKMIKDKDKRLDALLTLLDEVDFDATNNVPQSQSIAVDNESQSKVIDTPQQ